MLIWGSRGETVDFGEAGKRHCKVCEKERPFHIILQYRYSHIWYIFGSVDKKKYLYLCDICNRGWELDCEKVEQEFESNPIPFMSRHGAKIFVAIIVLIIIFISLA